jgi:hypothetical protein
MCCPCLPTFYFSVIIATGAAVLTVAKYYSAVGAWKRLAMVALRKFNSANNVTELFG